MGHELKIFAGESSDTPRPLHNPPTNLFVENYIKNAGKGLKNASFWVMNSKNFRGAVIRPPLPSGAANLFVEEKKKISKEGGGK